LGTLGRSLDQFGSVLDFGCGSGRVLPWIAKLSPPARGTGCDVDPVAIAWAVDHHPRLTWALSGSDPPLPFAAQSFSLIYSISVFSHLAEVHQDRWLGELGRVLKPGGVALLSVHGQYAFEQFRSGRVRSGWCPAEAFARPSLGSDEFVFVPYRRSIWNRGDLPGVSAEYGLAFHGEAYVTDHWSSALRAIAVLPHAMTGWQDIVVFTR
jgi:SAM-dependent methyltransferase